MKLRNTLILLICFLTLTFSAGAQNNSTGAQKDDKKQAAYNELLAKLKGGDTSIDFKALRMSFTETKDYSYHGSEKEEQAKMMKPLGEKKYKEAIKQAEKILEKNYVDANAHFVFYTASKELKDDKNAEFHRAVLFGLLNSIKDGNDGLTAKTSFLAITIDEEYALIKFLGYKVEGQSLQSADGHKYDVLSVVNARSGEKAKFYFNIDKIWEAETKLFGQ